jgi:pimeloyl-ACP methyl ester carboxylesterase
MGGLIGMGLAALPDSPIQKMVLNDIGPNLNFPALTRIGEYIGQDVRFDTFEQGRDYVRTVSAPFGPHSDDEWDKLARDVLRKDNDGHWRRHYDLAIAKGFEGITEESTKRGEAALWAAYDAIRAPVLLVRGSESDLLTHDTALAMTERGPRAQLVELPGVGHAPTFMHDDQMALVRRFLMD